MKDWLRTDSPTFVWLGVVVVGVGFALIALAWAQVAGETDVYRQLPYLVSAGMTGLGLIMVGVTLINVSVKRRDGAARERQMEQLTRVLEEIKASGR